MSGRLPRNAAKKLFSRFKRTWPLRREQVLQALRRHPGCSFKHSQFLCREQEQKYTGRSKSPCFKHSQFLALAYGPASSRTRPSFGAPSVLASPRGSHRLSSAGSRDTSSPMSDPGILDTAAVRTTWRYGRASLWSAERRVEGRQDLVPHRRQMWPEMSLISQLFVHSRNMQPQFFMHVT